TDRARRPGQLKRHTPARGRAAAYRDLAAAHRGAAEGWATRWANLFASRARTSEISRLLMSIAHITNREQDFGDEKGQTLLASIAMSQKRLPFLRRLCLES